MYDSDIFCGVLFLAPTVGYYAHAGNVEVLIER
ncbi:hypothetical protein SAMN02745866_01125 [Alteromonadaceae bacterium Bs31]|nr:hypothetical protein SAMN02745866_01125 [Alteromonadaceae bacterium Bs31]